MTQQMPKTLLQLIEHTELNKSGWWDSALNNVLLATIWMNGKPIPKEQVRDLVVSAFNLDIPEDRVAAGIERLIGSKQLIETENGQIAPTGSVADQMEQRLRDAQSNEDKVRESFFEKVGDCCAPYSPEESWNLFIERYFLPLIDMLGARTLQFLGENGTGDEHVGILTDRFVGLFDGSHQTSLRSAIGAFLDPNDLDVRRYVSEHLDASFLVKASGLTNDAILSISKFGQKRPSFGLFLDTNFLFSLLDLHENPSNESTQMLGQTIRQVGDHLSIRLNVIFPTMDEIKRTLRASQANLAGMRMSATLADAALAVRISGIAMRFARANAESERPISAKDYFQPYLRDLTPILRSKGIEVFNAKTTDYNQRQDVVNDVLEMVDIEGLPESEQQRRYNAALHDSILWHFVHDRRPQVFESPMDALFWVVTNDYRLINFDRKRRRAENSAAGVCIHPAELVQMLRLWEPRSSDMEQALMSGLRLPFMFYEYDSGGEAASIRILKALSRFEHIGYLESDAIRDIVLSDAVRSKTIAATSEEEENEVIRDALLAERQEIAEQRDAAVRAANEAEKALIRERELARSQASVGEEIREQAEEQVSTFQAELESAQEETRRKDEQVKALEGLLVEKDTLARVRSARIRATLVRGIGFGFLSAAAATGAGFGWISFKETAPLIVLPTMLLAWVVSWFVAATTRVHNPDVREWALMGKLIDLRRQTKLLIGAIVIGIIANAIWQILIWPNFSG